MQGCSALLSALLFCCSHFIHRTFIRAITRSQNLLPRYAPAHTPIRSQPDLHTPQASLPPALAASKPPAAGTGEAKELPPASGPSSAQVEAKIDPEDDLNHAFKQFDIDNSGELELREIMASLRLLGINKSMKEVKAVLGKFDSSGNGKLGHIIIQTVR